MKQGVGKKKNIVKPYHISKEDTIKNIAKEFSLPEEDAIEYVEKYW